MLTLTTEPKAQLPDQAERLAALDPAQSFIVQAPAGSGKTELLVQRFLTLLAQANHPEEIIAVTFTRKAAAEMRARLLTALQLAQNHIEEITPKTLIAQQVLKKDQELEWHLLENPNRLRIVTIDSLCAHLTKQMPLLSGFGTQPNIAENPRELYLQATRTILQTLENNQPWSAALQNILLHLDNNHAPAENLFINMLAKRDQWLPHVVGAKTTHLRTELEDCLKNIITETCRKCYEAFPKTLQLEMVEVAHYAANHLKSNNSDSAITACYQLQNFPQPHWSAHQTWLGMAELLLNKDFQWRQNINVNLGFPADKDPTSKLMKNKIKQIIQQLFAHEELRQNLSALNITPASAYSETQWQIIESLLTFLPVLAAQLTVTFREQGTVDFTEVMSAAIRALGEIDDPTDLALSLDYKIQHLLVDEFQDTSNSQFRLLELLTAGWQPGDGRSLFLVGDPQQSIYRFREAEVGLFLRTQHRGINQLPLQSIKLMSNFRSSENLVSWHNETYAKVFPEAENITTGAVKFNAAIAANPSNNDHKVSFHALLNASDQSQAEAIVDLIQSLQQHEPQHKIAILVKYRNHLSAIIQALKTAKIPFRGIEIEKLNETSVVQDLFALTRALLHCADRIAWLSILRAPWCGLTLADLYQLANKNQEKTLWSVLNDPEITQQLSLDGQHRLQRLVKVFATSIAERQRLPINQWVKATWHALNGPACLNNAAELEQAESFFNLLEKLNLTGNTLELQKLEDYLEKIYAPPDPNANENLQIMTIHKAKGLEFDTVIIPHLEKRSSYDDDSLLRWLELPRQFSNDSDLILAPIKSVFSKKDLIYNYLKQQDSEKTSFEHQRLFYVATTRAKKSLHLFANTNSKNDQELFKPHSGSFLDLIWPMVKPLFMAKLGETDPVHEPLSETETTHYIQRLALI